MTIVQFDLTQKSSNYVIFLCIVQKNMIDVTKV